MCDGDGNGWARCERGHTHWGRYGAAGLLLVDRSPPSPVVLLQHRAYWTTSGDTWGVPGGACDSHESVVEAALREAAEEAGLPAAAVRVFDSLVDDHGRWSYTTVLAELVAPVRLRAQAESAELRWVVLDLVDSLALHPGFARTGPGYAPGSDRGSARRRSKRSAASSGDAPASRKPCRAYNRVAGPLLVRTDNTTSSPGWTSAAQATTSRTAASPTPRPRAAGATQSEMSSTAPSPFGTADTIPAGRHSSSSTRLSGAAAAPPPALLGIARAAPLGQRRAERLGCFRQRCAT